MPSVRCQAEIKTTQATVSHRVEVCGYSLGRTKRSTEKALMRMHEKL